MTGETFWTNVFLIGIVQGIFLGSAMIFQPHLNRRASRSLALVITVLSWAILLELLEGILAPQDALLAMFLNINTELAIGPLGYLVVCFVLYPSRRWSSRDVLHFVPLAIGLVIWIIAWFEQVDNPAVYGKDLHSLPLVPQFIFLKALVFFGYIAATCQALKRGLENQRRFVVGRRTINMQVLRRWILGVSAVPVLIYSLLFLEILGVELRVESDQVGSLASVILIFFATLLMLLRPWILSIKSTSSRTSQWTEEIAQLNSFLAQKRPWLDPGLRLIDLATVLGLSENRLSAIINEGLDTTFYTLLTKYRLSEFERLAESEDCLGYSVLELAFRAGFNSKASFYRAFRENYDTTPVAFRRSLAPVISEI